jgi:hypothetical protein
MKLDLLKTLVESPLSRRDFAKKMGITAGGLVGASMLGSTLLGGVTKAAAQQSSAAATPSATVTDADILNFALNLEYLEAEFYTFATYGVGIVQNGVIPASAESGPTTGGHKVPNIMSSPVAYIAGDIRKDEQSHVKFLRSALGSAAVKKPTINLNALGIGFGSWEEFMILARAFEDVGSSAYTGAAPLISNKTYLEAAARILATEAQHSGAIRTHIIDRGIKCKPVDSVDVVPTTSTVFFTDNMGLTIPRTTRQVLNIVYAGGTTKGGFYPDGMNGTIK